MKIKLTIALVLFSLLCSILVSCNNATPAETTAPETQSPVTDSTAETTEEATTEEITTEAPETTVQHRTRLPGVYYLPSPQFSKNTTRKK